MKSDLELRESVQWFAQQMERKLRKNDHKPGWQNDSDESLIDRIEEEVEELKRCGTKDLIDEAADVANFAMMIADNQRV